MLPRYEIQDPSTRYEKGSFEKEPTSKIRVLNADRSQRYFLTRSMTISREVSSEKEFDGDEDRDSVNSPTRWRFRGSTHPPPSPCTIAGELHAWGEWG
jgi:hypothetical protein